MAEDMGEKTEQPTDRKLADARNRGQVVKSADFSGALDLIGAVVLLALLGSGLVQGLAGMTRALLAGTAPGSGAGAAGLDELFMWSLTRAAMVALPLGAAMFGVVYAAQLVQVGFLLSNKPLEPKLERLNPIANFGKVLGKRNVVKTGFTVLKLSLITTVVVMFIMRHLPEIAGLPALGFLAGYAKLGELVWSMAVWMLALMFTIGAADWLYQRWQHTTDLRMSKQEVKDERKTMEGDLESKARRLRMARQMILQRARTDVPRADVVVTNPTHFSVALKYDGETMAAPKVVAKGADYLAFRIREIATAAGVPIVEKPALARALYANVEVGREVNPEHYEAVAEILAYVYRLNKGQSLADSGQPEVSTPVLSG